MSRHRMFYFSRKHRAREIMEWALLIEPDEAQVLKMAVDRNVMISMPSVGWPNPLYQSIQRTEQPQPWYSRLWNWLLYA